MSRVLKEARGSGKKLVDSDLVNYKTENPSFARGESGGLLTANSYNQPYAASLNGAMVRAIGDENWSKAYVTTDLLPSFRKFAAATKAAFGTNIAGIKPTEQKFNIFNGIKYGGTNYINLDESISFINITG